MAHIRPKNLAAFGQTTFSPVGRGGLGTRLNNIMVICVGFIMTISLFMHRLIAMAMGLSMLDYLSSS